MDNSPSANECYPKAGESMPFSQVEDPSGVSENPLEPPPLATLPLEPSETLPTTVPEREAAGNPTQAEPDFSVRNKSPTKARDHLRRRTALPNLGEPDLVKKALQPLTDEERRNWPGWVELESDPVRSLLAYHRLGPTETH